MMKLTIDQQKHLISRAGFGIPLSKLKNLKDGSDAEKLVDELFDDSRLVEDFDIIGSLFYSPDMKGLSKVERKKQRKEGRLLNRGLNLHWLRQMAESESQLREKMAFFWHDHFACRSLFAGPSQSMVNTIRKHALGNFRAMLHAVAKEPAMLQFLNNQQNRKASPNENFAREVMELFTLGRGNYTEKDIKEAARAFTGWGFNLKSEFVFREDQHDFGSKTFFGLTGEFSGEKVLDIILSQKQTAKYLTAKICHFLAGAPAPEMEAEQLADEFFERDYDISLLVRKILTSEWFYQPEYIGGKIKSPVELIAGLQRMLSLRYGNTEPLIKIQRALGQVLFFPPGVAGWPDGRGWIDSSSLFIRMRLPLVMLGNEEIDIRMKEDPEMDGEEMMQAVHQAERIGKQLEVEMAWEPVYEALKEFPEAKLPEKIAGWLLQPRLSEQQLTVIAAAAAAGGGRETYIRNLVFRILSLPEFQLT